MTLKLPRPRVSQLKKFLLGSTFLFRVLTSGVQAIPVVASGTATVEVDCLEKALGIEFSDPNGVVQRQLLAK